MGVILASGVLANLKAVLPNLSDDQLRLLAERVAAGNAVSMPELTSGAVHQALASGFGWIMLYGGLGVWIMAAASFLVFNAKSVREAKIQCPD